MSVRLVIRCSPEWGCRGWDISRQSEDRTIEVLNGFFSLHTAFRTGPHVYGLRKRSPPGGLGTD
jgi:hypothetical protein